MQEDNTNQLKVIFEKVGEKDGKEVFKYHLSNGTIQVELTNYGGIISRIIVPDKNGKLENVVLSLENIPDYFTDDHPYLGAVIGRYANRIANASFELGGNHFEVTANTPPNHIHGGAQGFSKQVWESETFTTANSVGVKMSYLSVDGEEGYPGNLQTDLSMELTSDNELKVKFESTTDRKTIVNLTSHSYFNLNGMSSDIRDHELQIFANAYTPTNEALITTGEIKEVVDTPFDFSAPRTIGEQMDKLGRGFDENFVTKKELSPSLIIIARAKDPKSGRVMEVYSTAPGVQLYTANYIKDFKGAEGKIYQPYWAFCLEPQAWPDSPNKPNFPSASISPEEKYVHEIVYKFSVGN